MDHWGDPWADDADTDAHTHTTSAIATPAKVAEPRPPARATLSPGLRPASIVLNGFEDEAGWGGNAWATTPSPRKDTDAETEFGREVAQKIGWDVQHEVVGGRGVEEGLSAWVTAPAQEEVSVDGGANGVEHASSWDTHTGHDDRTRHDNSENEAGNEWSRIEEVVEESKSVENGISEPSDSVTTIHADDAPAQTDETITAELPREDDASTRSSESHSDGSHNEAVTESPRTSVEEERAAVKSAEATHGNLEGSEEIDLATEQHESPEQDVEDDFGDFEDEVAREATEAQLDAEATSGQPKSLPNETEQDMGSDIDEAPAENIPTGPVGNFVLDSKLLAELFPSVKNSPQMEEAPDSPVSSTSTRKVWYRITRKQTMREYNSGAVDDNYIRVTWKTSHIKSEAVKTVARWANEDRIAGRGPGARASFFWDSPHSPTDKRASFASPHSRKTSAASVSKPVRPVSQALPPISTDGSAAFDWSSPSSATHTVPDTSGLRSTSSPIVAKHSAITKLQRQSRRAVSVDLSSSPRATSSHRRTSTATELHHGPPAVYSSKFTPIEAHPRVSFDPWSSKTTSSPVAPVSAPPTEKFDPWASLGALDTGSYPKAPSAAPDDDDEDWGEMVESPAVSTVQAPISRVPTPIAEFSEPPTRDDNVLITSTIPVSARSSPLPLPTAPVHASPIVRLRGIVSPTSAIFGPKALVPTDSEERIGPHLLKKRDRSREATPEKARAMSVQLPSMDETLSRAPVGEDPRESSTNTESVVIPDSTSPPPPATSPPLHKSNDSTNPAPYPPPLSDEPNWADDADFSIFESALPPSSSTAPAPPQQSDTDDPWSIFNSPPSAEPFVRPAATSPVKQPPTSATSSAQQRKTEDDFVRGIVEGLPDLGYMLRR
ncbi:hypothetical protein P171DRAFT_428572 [Karstenula rhodostoma CBS 690.94]|uniref:Uncharacterized protein n=1 Tax=Karstenula rhodostoma CBS 690.94 TaxID=1392251 RepID=A0A9P4PQX3_9PLEO|nr:hypothetical protein P171DRAFT_428572 [Karstenula rhodostoma CBS 690.94]